MATIILGSGIIGVSTAYYLSQFQPPSSIHLVEPSPQLFASASGNAGGFLAKDWFGPSMAQLGSLSFDEHRRLAEKYNGREKWGYSTSTCSSYIAGSRKALGGKRGDDWLRHDTSRAEAEPAGVTKGIGEGHGFTFLTRREGDELEIISEQDSTAQV